MIPAAVYLPSAVLLFILGLLYVIIAVASNLIRPRMYVWPGVAFMAVGGSLMVCFLGGWI